MRRVALLDLNILVALFHPDHVHHDLAHDWFGDEGRGAWATCPLTENGFVRIMTSAATGIGERPASVLDKLRRFCSVPEHHFWPDQLSLLDSSVFAPPFIVGPRQITDIYLLGLAKRMDGTLATFDRSIPLDAVRGATAANISVIAPRSENRELRTED